MNTPPGNPPPGHDPDKVRARVWRTVWICVGVIVVLLGSFWAEHL